MTLKVDMSLSDIAALAERMGITSVPCTSCGGDGRGEWGDCGDCSGEGSVDPGMQAGDNGLIHHTMALLIEAGQEGKDVEDIDEAALQTAMATAKREIAAVEAGAMIGFDTFLGWRSECDDIAAKIGEDPEYFNDDGDKVSGFIYEGDGHGPYYITRQKDGRLHLHISRCEWTDTVLTMLERVLFHTFASGEINETGDAE